MTRLLLAACLALFAADAAARGSDPAAGSPAACPQTERTAEGKPAASESEGDAPRPGAAAPVRPRSVSGARPGPRWHSLLPGMIR